MISCRIHPPPTPQKKNQSFSLPFFSLLCSLHYNSFTIKVFDTCLRSQYLSSCTYKCKADNWWSQSDLEFGDQAKKESWQNYVKRNYANSSKGWGFKDLMLKVEDVFATYYRVKTNCAKNFTKNGENLIVWGWPLVIESLKGVFTLKI